MPREYDKTYLDEKYIQKRNEVLEVLQKEVDRQEHFEKAKSGGTAQMGADV